MKSVFINLVHTFIKDNNIEIAESDSDHDNSASSSSSRSTIDEHDYIINQAISNNKGGNKVHKASEMSPGNPARMMSSKEGRNRTRMQEKKSAEKLKSYKTQVNWSLKR